MAHSLLPWLSVSPRKLDDREFGQLCGLGRGRPQARRKSNDFAGGAGAQLAGHSNATASLATIFWLTDGRVAKFSLLRAMRGRPQRVGFPDIARQPGRISADRPRCIGVVGPHDVRLVRCSYVAPVAKTTVSRFVIRSARTDPISLSSASGRNGHASRPESSGPSVSAWAVRAAPAALSKRSFLSDPSSSSRLRYASKWMPRKVRLIRSAVPESPDLWPAVLTAAGALILVTSGGLPLAFGCRRPWGLGYREGAWWGGVAFGAATDAASVFAGLLGPGAIAVCAMVFSLLVFSETPSLRWRFRERHSFRLPDLW